MPNSLYKPLVFITTLFWTCFATPESILGSLKRDFFHPNGAGNQYGVLYLHRGSVDLPPDYDFHAVCANVKQKISDWRNRIGGEGEVAALNPPLWPTNALAQLQCTGHPNIAVAGRDKSQKNNYGHSEYFLLKEPLDALGPMLTSYKKNERDTCPNAVFLYSRLSPCKACAGLVLSAHQRIMDECRAKRSMPTFYLGCTREFDPRT